jgi:hypothetical protein
VSRRPWWATILLTGLVVAVLAGVPRAGGLGTARAAVDTEVGIADDAQLLYEGPAAMARAVRAWQAMGVDTVRIHARWAFVVPRPLGRRMPAGFHPRDPNDRNYNWAALDRAVAALNAADIRPVLAITGSGPVWASLRPALDNPRYKPRPAMFGDFAHAVAARYKGQVTRYLIWNEPNQPAWLQPQFRCTPQRVCTPVAPHLYRELFRAAAAEVRDVDPSAEVLAGTLAPRGQAPHAPNVPMRPLQFIRSLGCVKADYHRDRSGPCRQAHPIQASAFSYHPHPIQLSPGEHDPQPDNAAIGDIKRLERALDRTTAAGVLTPTTGPRFNLYFTEFGYQTNPPDPISGVSLSRQAAWIQWGSYLAWRDPRIKNITQYEWIDEPVKVASKTGALYAGWQSGMLTSTRRRKPLAGAFPNPFYVDVLPHRRARFWGQVRPGGATKVRLQRKQDGRWQTQATLFTNAHGYWYVDRPLRAPGRFRFTYRLASHGPRPGPLVASRSQAVRPRS